MSFSKYSVAANSNQGYMKLEEVQEMLSLAGLLEGEQEIFGLNSINPFGGLLGDVSKVSDKIGDSCENITKFFKQACPMVDNLDKLILNTSDKIEDLCQSPTSKTVGSLVTKLKENWFPVLVNLYGISQSRKLEDLTLPVINLFNNLGFDLSIIDKIKEFSTSKAGANQESYVESQKVLLFTLSFLSSLSPVSLLGKLSVKNNVAEMEAMNKLFDMFSGVLSEWGFDINSKAKAMTVLREQLVKIIEKLPVYEHDVLFDQRKFQRNEYYKDFTTTKAMVDDMRKDVSMHSFSDLRNSNFSAELMEIYRRFKTLSERVERIRACATSRVETVGFCVIGDAGIGKSMVVGEIISRIRKTKRTEPLCSEFVDYNTWNQNPKCKHHDGYTDQEFHQVDDGFQSQDDQDHLDIFGFISPLPFITVQADLASKGNVYKGRLYGTSCNVFPRTSKTIKCIEGLHRRFLCIEPIVVSAVPQKKDGRDPDFKHLNFVVSNGRNYLKNKTNKKLIPMTLDQIVELLIDDMIANDDFFEAELAQQQAGEEIEWYDAPEKPLPTGVPKVLDPHASGMLRQMKTLNREMYLTLRKTRIPLNGKDIRLVDYLEILNSDRTVDFLLELQKHGALPDGNFMIPYGMVTYHWRNEKLIKKHIKTSYAEMEAEEQEIVLETWFEKFKYTFIQTYLAPHPLLGPLIDVCMVAGRFVSGFIFPWWVTVSAVILSFLAAFIPPLGGMSFEACFLGFACNATTLGISIAAMGTLFYVLYRSKKNCSLDKYCNNCLSAIADSEEIENMKLWCKLNCGEKHNINCAVFHSLTKKVCPCRDSKTFCSSDCFHSMYVYNQASLELEWVQAERKLKAFVESTIANHEARMESSKDPKQKSKITTRRAYENTEETRQNKTKNPAFEPKENLEKKPFVDLAKKFKSPPVFDPKKLENFVAEEEASKDPKQKTKVNTKRTFEVAPPVSVPSLAPEWMKPVLSKTELPSTLHVEDGIEIEGDIVEELAKLEVSQEENLEYASFGCTPGSRKFAERKNNIRMQLNAKQESCPDLNARAIISPLAKLTVKIFRYNKIAQTKSFLHGIGYQNWIISPQHIHVPGNSRDFVYTFMRGEEEIELTFGAENKNLDLAIWKFEGSPFSNTVMKHLMTNEVYEARMGVEKVGYQYIPMADSSAYFMQIVRVCFRSTLLTINLANGEQANMAKVLRVNATKTSSPVTSYGDCGGFIVMEDMTSPQKLIGMHVIGATNGAYSAILTKCILNSLIVKASRVREESEEEPVRQSCPSYPVIENKLAAFPIVDIENLLLEEHSDPPFMPEGNFEYIAEVPFDRPPTKSTLRAHPFSNLFDLDVAPAALHWTQVPEGDLDKIPLDKKGIPDLMLMKTEKFGGTPPVLNDEDAAILDCAVDELTDLCVEVMDGENLGPCDWNTAIGGDPFSIDSHKLDPATSAGYSWNKFGKQLLKKGQYFSVNDKQEWHIADTPAGDRLRNNLAETERLGKIGVRTASLIKNCLKDEVRPLDKVWKPRLFMAYPIDKVLLMRKYFLRFKTAWTKAGLKLMHAVGVDPLSTSWADLYLHLKRIGDYGYDADFGGFDTNQWSFLQKATAKMMLNTISRVMANRGTPLRDEDRLMMEVLIDENIHSLCVSNSTVYMTEHGNKSGSPNTTPDNTNLDVLLHLFCFFKITGKRSLASFLKEVAICCFSDDVFYTTTPNSLYTFDNVQKVMQDVLHIEYTAGDKGSTCVAKPVEELVFLRRTFVKHTPSIILAPLDKASIEMRFCWTNIKELDMVGHSTLIYEGLMEACLHGPKYYNELRTKLRSGLVRCGWSQHPDFLSCTPCYSDMFGEFLARYQRGGSLGN